MHPISGSDTLRFMDSGAHKSGPPGPPAARSISATQAAQVFSELLNKVQYQGERFIIERDGEPICELAPVGAGPIKYSVADLVALLRSLPPVDDDFASDVREVLQGQPSLPPSPWE